MSLLVWSAVGLLSGFLGGKLLHKPSGGVILDLLLGLIGAIIGGYVFQVFEPAGETDLNLYSLLVAIAGSGLLLTVYHARHRRA